MKPNLYVLEGRNYAALDMEDPSYLIPPVMHVPGLVSGVEHFQFQPEKISLLKPVRQPKFETDLMGAKFFKRMSRKASNSVTQIAKAPLTATKATTHALAQSARVTTRVTRRGAIDTGNIIKAGATASAHAVAQSARVTGRVVRRSAETINRIAKRIIAGVARKVLLQGIDLQGDEVLGEVSLTKMGKTKAKTLLAAPATAAVAASPVPSAAPLVPVLVSEVVDELYDSVKKKMSKGMSEKDAVNESLKELETDTGPSTGMILLGVGAVVGLLFIIKKRRK